MQIKNLPVPQLLKRRYYIGIDTGVNTGIAAWDKLLKGFCFIKSVKIHTAMAMVKDLHEKYPEGVFVRVEDARLRKWIPKGKTEVEERGRREGAGYVKRDAVIWEDYLTELGIPFDLVAPKNNKTKLNSENFKKYTNWKERVNDHARDAAMLVFGF